mmetsp:Transcript_57887/g.166035  ORF Transcript_57887/g.166035 Transcript_57887/m.166035 type:complete len:267 (-) Transcript_57887:309-1109(-)
MLELLLVLDNADHAIIAHHAHASDVGVYEALLVPSAMHAVRHDTSKGEVVAGRGSGHEEALRPDLLEEMHEGPAGVNGRAGAAIRHAAHTELPLLVGGLVLAQRDDQDLGVLAIGDEAAGGVPGAADADLVPIRPRVVEQVPDGVFVRRHDPGCASVDVVAPVLPVAPIHALVGGALGARLGQRLISECRALEVGGHATAAAARLAQREVAQLVELTALMPVRATCFAVVEGATLMLPIAIAIVVLGHTSAILVVCDGSKQRNHDD